MMRVAPYIAQRAALSRRQAEQAILQGRVSRHGVPVTSFYVPDMDGVALDGQILLDPPEPKAWIYHKPPGQLVTRHDPQGRPTVWSTLRHWMPDGPLVCVGRLDALSEGLLIATNHPPLAHLLETSRQPRVYRVWVNGLFTPKNTAILRKGIVVDDIQYRPIRVVIEEASPEGSQLKVTLTEGKKREIRIVMDALGTPVTRLLRLSFGPWSLHDQGEGTIVEIASQEIQDFMRTTPRPEDSLNQAQGPAPSSSIRPVSASSSRGSGFSSRSFSALSSARSSGFSARGGASASYRGDASVSSRGPSGTFAPLRSSPSFQSRASRPVSSGQRSTSAHAKAPSWTKEPKGERPSPRAGGDWRLPRTGERSDRPSYPRSPKPFGAQGDKPRAPKPYGTHSERSSYPRSPFGAQSDKPRAPKPYGTQSERSSYPRSPFGAQSDKPRAPKPYGTQSERSSYPRSPFGAQGDKPRASKPFGTQGDRPSYGTRPRPHGSGTDSLDKARRQPSRSAGGYSSHARTPDSSRARSMRPSSPMASGHHRSRIAWTQPKAPQERPTLSLNKKGD